MVLRVVGALILKKASAPYPRQLCLQRRRICSSSPCCGELRQNGPWMQDDTWNCERRCDYHVLADGSIGILQKQHSCEGASSGLLQRHDGSNCWSFTQQQQGHLHPVPQVHDNSDPAFQMSKLCKQHEKFDKANDSHASTLQLHTFDHHDSSMQLRLDIDTEQGEYQSSPARLWEEKEQVFASFSSRYTSYLAENQGDEYSLEDQKSGLLISLCREGQLDRALDVLFCMNPSPSTPVYLFLLKECNKNKAPIHAKKVYAHFDHHHPSFGDLIAEFLVLSVSNSSALQSIHVTSFSLPWLSVFAWSAMISALVEGGHMKEALQMMQRMHDDGAEPSSYIFVSLIKACSIIKDLYHGMKLHAAAVMKGFASHLIVGSTLVSMYGKCDAILETETVFNTLCAHDAVSCNTMLTAFVDAGQGERALLLYRQMYAEGIHANHGTFVMALQACRCLAEEEGSQLVGERLLKKMSLEIGLALHSAIRREGFVLDAFINNTLLNMYGKIGAIVEAELVFDTLPDREIISWNAMLSTYIENSQGQKALWLYRMLLQEDVDADPLTCVFALQACNIIAEDEQAVIIEGKTIKMRSLRLGQALHLDACTMGFASDVFLGTALISMYGKCGAIEEAEDVFLCLAERDIVSWNAVISTYIEQEQGEKALHLFRQMQEEGVGANPQTFVFALQACAILAEIEEAVLVVNKGRSIKAMALEIGQSLHGLALRKHFTNSFICNTLVSMYGTSGAIVEAEHVFLALSPADVVSWNVMLSAYVDQGQAVPALQLFSRMHERGMAPNHLTFMCALQACGILAEKERAVSVEGMLKKVVSLEIGGALHKDALAKGFTTDAFVGNTLLSMYAKCGDVLERDSLFGSLRHRDIVSWNPLLSMCVEKGKAEQALRLYKQLQEEWVIPDDATLIFILQACGMTGNLLICEQVHFSIVSAGYDQNPSVAATLLNAYGSCAMVADTQVCFNGLLKGDTVSWNAFIAGHLGEEDIASTARLYEEMIQTRIDPDEVTFTSVLSGCSHSGLVDGFEYFKYMSQHHVIAPNLRHYGAVIDLFGRAGDFKRVQILLERMPWEPDLPIALCLLGASGTHGNFALAEWAFNLAVRLQPKQPTAYVLMSNIYADTRPL